MTIQDIEQQVLAGRTQAQIAEVYGKSPSWVGTQIKTRDFRRRNGWIGNVEPKKVAAICSLYESDQRLSVHTVATATGVQVKAVIAVLRAQQVPRRRARTFNPEEVRAIIATYGEGIGCPSIARDHGVHEITIRRVLTQNGIVRRRRGSKDRR
jgi:hypothetical protein